MWSGRLTISVFSKKLSQLFVHTFCFTFGASMRNISWRFMHFLEVAYINIFTMLMAPFNYNISVLLSCSLAASELYSKYVVCGTASVCPLASRESGSMPSQKKVAWKCILEPFEAIPLYICNTQS